MTKYEKSSLIVNVILLILTLWMFIENSRLTQLLHQEDTEGRLRSTIQAENSGEQPGRIIFRSNSEVGSPNPVYFRQRFQWQLSNTGNMPITITKPRIEPLERDTNIIATDQWNFIAPISFVDSKGNPITFPLSVPPREIKLITIELGVGITREAWSEVATKIKVDTELPYYETRAIFASAGQPYFGQIDSAKPVIVGSKEHHKSRNFINYLISFAKEDGRMVNQLFNIHDPD